MSEDPFHLTVAGRRFHGHTGPALARSLDRIAAALKALAEPDEHDSPSVEPGSGT
jgi:hypothetical protein